MRCQHGASTQGFRPGLLTDAPSGLKTSSLSVDLDLAVGQALADVLHRGADDLALAAAEEVGDDLALVVDDGAAAEGAELEGLRLGEDGRAAAEELGGLALERLLARLADLGPDDPEAV